MKILAITLTVLISIGLTSCSKDSDKIVSGVFIMKTTGTAPYTFVFTDSNVKYIADSPDMIASINLSINDIVRISWHYNADDQGITDKSTQVNITVLGIEKLTAPSIVSTDNGESFENSTINKIAAAGDQSTNGILFFNNNIVLIPIIFLAEKELTKHLFTLVYNSDGTGISDTELKLYLRHNNTEAEKPTYFANVYQSFDIKEALQSFISKTGSKPTKITIMASETKKQESNTLEDAKSELSSYSVDYK